MMLVPLCREPLRSWMTSRHSLACGSIGTSHYCSQWTRGVRSSSPTTLPLQWVDRHTHLGILVSRHSKDYVKDNLDPVLIDVKSKLKAWSNLPHSLIGCIDLKMKVLPKFMYIFRNSPQWLPQTFFDLNKRLFLSFIWGSKPPRYKCTTLTRRIDRGGLAMPDCFKYLLASQLVTAHWWLQPDLTNSAVVLEAAIVKSLEALQVLLFRGKKSPPSSYPLHAYHYPGLESE